MPDWRPLSLARIKSIRMARPLFSKKHSRTSAATDGPREAPRKEAKSNLVRGASRTRPGQTLRDSGDGDAISEGGAPGPRRDARLGHTLRGSADGVVVSEEPHPWYG